MAYIVLSEYTLWPDLQDFLLPKDKHNPYLQEYLDPLKYFITNCHVCQKIIFRYPPSPQNTRNCCGLSSGRKYVNVCDSLECYRESVPYKVEQVWYLSHPLRKFLNIPLNIPIDMIKLETNIHNCLTYMVMEVDEYRTKLMRKKLEQLISLLNEQPEPDMFLETTDKFIVIDKQKFINKVRNITYGQFVFKYMNQHIKRVYPFIDLYRWGKMISNIF